MIIKLEKSCLSGSVLAISMKAGVKYFVVFKNFAEWGQDGHRPVVTWLQKTFLFV